MDNDECKIPCVGLFADVKKLAPKYDRNIKHLVFLERYKAYKRHFEPNSGKYFQPIQELRPEQKVRIPIIKLFIFVELVSRADLQYVRISFDTPTFDRITKDRSAKFVDMLSAIGGTMGLLTGFSIISGVEILYFLFMIFSRVASKILQKFQF